MTQSIISLLIKMSLLVLQFLVIQPSFFNLAFAAGDPVLQPLYGQCRSVLFKFLLVKQTFHGNNCADMCRSAYVNFESAVDNLRTEANIRIAKRRKSQSKHGQPYKARKPSLNLALDVCVPKNDRCFNGQQEVRGDLRKASAAFPDPKTTCQSSIPGTSGCTKAFPRSWQDYDACSCIKSLLLYTVRNDNYPAETAGTCLPDKICARLADTISSRLKEEHDAGLNSRDIWQCFSLSNPPADNDLKIQIIDPQVPCSRETTFQTTICKHCNPKRCESSSGRNFLEQCPQLEPFDPATYKTYLQWKREQKLVVMNLGEASTSQTRSRKRPRGIAFGDNKLQLGLINEVPAQAYQEQLNLDLCLNTFADMISAVENRHAETAAVHPSDPLPLQPSTVSPFQFTLLGNAAEIGRSSSAFDALSGFQQPTEADDTQVCPCACLQDDQNGGEEDADDFEDLSLWL